MGLRIRFSKGSRI